MQTFFLFTKYINSTLGLYETPGGAILIAAHMDIETFTMDRVGKRADYCSDVADDYIYFSLKYPYCIQEKVSHFFFFDRNLYL